MAERFAQVSEEEIQTLLSKTIPNNTKKMTKYGIKIFNDWFTASNMFEGLYITEMTKTELNSCLKLFYTSSRQTDGSYYKKSTMKSIRAAIDRFLRCPPNNKGFSIIGDPEFSEANAVLDAFVKDLRKTGKIAGLVHKKPITQEQIKLLFSSGELGHANSDDPAQLLRTTWFYLGFYLGRRGRENQRQLKPNMLALRSTAEGKLFFELNREAAGSIPSTKNHQGGLGDVEDEADGKIFAKPNSRFCPVKTIQSYMKHLNPSCDALFQRPKVTMLDDGRSNPNREVWYYNSPVGESTLGNMLRQMTSRAGINPPLTNHCIRATAVTVLSQAQVETRKSVTAHKSDQSIEAYSSRPSIEQHEKMSSLLGDYLEPEMLMAQPSLMQKAAENPRDSCERETPHSHLENGSNSSDDNQTTITVNKRSTHLANGPTFNFQNCDVQIYN